MRRVAFHGRMGLALLVALVMMVPLAGPASAQSVGPDGFGYVGNTSGGSAFEDISATGTAIVGLEDVDDASVAVPIGFDFFFYGVQYTDVFVASNGLLTFGSGNATFTNVDLTTDTSIPQPLIAPVWDDWITSCDPAAPPDIDMVFSQSFGDRFIVQWDGVSHFGACDIVDTYTFQVVLFADGSMEFRYLDVQSANPAVDFGASATVGIRDFPPSPDDPPSLTPNVLQFSFNQATLADGQSMRIENICGIFGCTGGGGGGDGDGRRRARTRLSLNGPNAADAGDDFTLRGRVRSRRDACERRRDIRFERDGRFVGVATTNQNGQFSFQTGLLAGDARATFTATVQRNGRCRGSSDQVIVR